VNSKEESSEDFCPNYVQEFGHRRPRFLFGEHNGCYNIAHLANFFKRWMQVQQQPYMYSPLFLHSFYCISLLFTSTYRINFLLMYRTISLFRDKIAPLTESKFFLSYQWKAWINRPMRSSLIFYWPMRAYHAFAPMKSKLLLHLYSLKKMVNGQDFHIAIFDRFPIFKAKVIYTSMYVQCTIHNKMFIRWSINVFLPSLSIYLAKTFLIY
jgi:hypothetical protein